MNPDERRCPFCDEVIRAAAIRCKHCHADLSVAPLAARELARARKHLVPPAAAEQSIADSVTISDVSDLLTQMVDRSLVMFDEPTYRYRLLETVRQYARDRLVESGEAEVWRDRHLALFVALADEAEPELNGAEQQAWLERLEAEHDNLRAALAWAGESGQLDEGLRLAGGVWRFWEVRGHLGEGRGWLSGLLDGGQGQLPVRAKALNGAGVMSYQQGHYAASQAAFEESLAIRREIGDRRGVAASLGNLGELAHDRGDFAAAWALFEESLEVASEMGNRRGVAASLGSLGVLSLEQGDYAAARPRIEESLAIRRELGDRRAVATLLGALGVLSLEQGDYLAAWALHEESLVISRELGDRLGIALSLGNLGEVAHDQGDYAAARSLFGESLEIACELGDRVGIAVSLAGMASVLAALGSPGSAALLWGAAEGLREELGTTPPPSERRRYERQAAAARAAMGNDPTFDAAWQEGRAMPLERAIELALSIPGEVA